MCAPKRQWLPAPSTVLGTLVGFSVGFGAPLLHLTGVGVRVDISLCGIPSKSTWFLSLHAWLEHENTSRGLRHQTSTNVWRHQGLRRTHLSCSSPQPAARGRVLLSVISLSHSRHSWHKSLQVCLFVHSLVIPPLRILFVFAFSFCEAGTTPCSPSSSPETQPEKSPFSSAADRVPGTCLGLSWTVPAPAEKTCLSTSRSNTVTEH